MKEIDSSTYNEIERLSQVGDEYLKKEDFPNALSSYWNAYDLIPEPKKNWGATTWVLTAIGDTNFFANDFEAGRDNLSNAMHCPEALGNPFIHLRLGQCLFELGNEERASNELTRAYALGGKEIFEDDHPKYFEFLKTKIKLEKPKKKPWWKF